MIASLGAAIAGQPSPLEATAELLMEWTPPNLADLILRQLGPIARPAALLGALAIAMLAGGIAGALQALLASGPRGRLLGLVPATAFLWFVFTRLIPPSSQIPELWLVASTILLLGLLSGPPKPVTGRREFLMRTGTILGGAAVLVTVFSVRPLLDALGVRRLFAFKAPSGLPIRGLADLVTPADRHYVMDRVLENPAFGPPSWQLRIDGLVGRPVTLDYGSLLSRPRWNRYVTMECVDNSPGGSLISTCLWSGIRATDLLREAGMRGDTAVFHGADNHSEGIPIHELAARGAMLAYAMNGEVLAREHGYPARLILPGHYGFKSVKWLEHIEVIRGEYRDEWVSHGWTATAVIHTTTRLDVARRSSGEILVAGMAFAGTRGIREVQVRVNGGPWHAATLGPTLSNATWRQWAIRLQGDGSARVEARAIDGHGSIQTSERHGSYPDGATGWATVTV